MSEWASTLTARFDLVVCNPPYIARSERRRLAPEVLRFDPEEALFGAADGLDAYRVLAPKLPRLLNAGAWACLEVGVGQAESVMDLLGDAGLIDLAAIEDLNGLKRCVCGKK